MKQKFTLNIADIQLSVIADASREDVERIRGLLDRKMREIYLKSRCPKTEAALLCAMDFAADRATLQEQLADLETQCEKYALVLDGLKARTADQSAELERLRSENAVLRSLLTKDAAPAVAPDPISPADFFAEVANAQIAAAPEETEETEETEESASAPAEAPTEVPAEVCAEPVADEGADGSDPLQVDIFELPEEAPSAEAAPEAAPAVETPPAREIPQSRSRVGSMFEHLSFGDID